MEKCLRWDTDGDGINDNAGFADHTFDAWTMKGTRLYVNSLDVVEFEIKKLNV